MISEESAFQAWWQSSPLPSQPSQQASDLHITSALKASNLGQLCSQSWTRSSCRCPWSRPRPDLASTSWTMACPRRNHRRSVQWFGWPSAHWLGEYLWSRSNLSLHSARREGSPWSTPGSLGGRIGLQTHSQRWMVSLQTWSYIPFTWRAYISSLFPCTFWEKSLSLTS